MGHVFHQTLSKYNFKRMPHIQLSYKSAGGKCGQTQLHPRITIWQVGQEPVYIHLSCRGEKRQFFE